MSNQRRQRRPFLSIGLLMRRFSRALAQRYFAEDDPFTEPEEETAEWDDSTESPSPTRRARAVARPAQSVDEAIKAAERVTPTPTSRPVQRAAAPKPAPPRPATPAPAPAPLPVVNPTPQPIQRAPDPVPAAPLQPTSVSQPASASNKADKPAEIAWPEGVPRTWNGQPIPISNTPTPPALKAWIQREREREARRKEILEERKDKLLSELPPPPEDPNAPRGRRLRPRGHTGVDYINTASLRGDEPHQPVQRNFDLSMNDTSEQSPAAPREPSPQRGERPTGDDDETSTPSLANEGADYHTALDAAIQRAESLDDVSGVEGETPAPKSRSRRAKSAQPDPEALSTGTSQASIEQANVQRSDSATASNPPPPTQFVTVTPPRVTQFVQRESEAQSPSEVDADNFTPVSQIEARPDVPDPSVFAAQGEDSDAGFANWDADDAPDVPESELASTDIVVQRDTDGKKLTQNTLVAEEDDISVNSDVAPSGMISLQRQAAIDAAIQRAEAPSVASDVPAWDPSVTPLSSLQAQFFVPTQTASPEPDVRRSDDAVESADAGDDWDAPAAPIQRQAADNALVLPPFDVGDSQIEAESPIAQPYETVSPSTPPTVQRQAAIDAAIQRAESVNSESSSESPSPRKPSKRSAAPTPPKNTDISAPTQSQTEGQAPIQRQTIDSPTASAEPRFMSTDDPNNRASDSISHANTASTPPAQGVSEPNPPAVVQRQSESAPISPARQAAIEAAIQRAEAPPVAAPITPAQDVKTVPTVEGRIQRQTVIVNDDSTLDTPEINETVQRQPDSDAPIQRAAEPMMLPPENENFTPTDDGIKPPPSSARPTVQRETESDVALQRTDEISAAPSESTQQSLIEAAVQRAEARVDIAPESVLDSDVPVSSAPSISSSDRPLGEVYGGVSGDGSETVATDTPTIFQRQAAIDATIQRAETPVDLSTDFDGEPSVVQRQAVIDAAIQRAETPVDFSTDFDGEPSVVQRQAAIDAAIQRAETPVDLSTDFDGEPSVVQRQAVIDAAIQRAETPVDLSSDFDAEPSAVQRQATIDAAIQRAETPVSPVNTPAAQPFTPPTRTSAKSKPSSAASIPEQPASPSTAKPPVAQSAIDAAIQRAEALPASGMPQAQPFTPRTRTSKGETPDLSLGLTPAGLPSTPRPMENPSRGETSEITSAFAPSGQATVQRTASHDEGWSSESENFTALQPNPIQRPADPARPTPIEDARSTGGGGSSPVVPQAVIDAAIQRAEAIPVVSTPVARPYIPTARKLTDPAPEAQVLQRSTANPTRQAEGEATAILPAPDMTYDFDSFDTPFEAVQRDADEFPNTWEDVSESSAAQPAERPDLFQAMAAAGMVASPANPSQPAIQRASDDYTDAKLSAIQRAETPAQRPDLFQALKAAGMVSDANAAQTARSAEPPPLVSNTLPVNTPLQRALGTDSEARSEEERPSQDKEGIPPNIDIDQLANDVYRVLRNKMRVDAERRPK